MSQDLFAARMFGREAVTALLRDTPDFEKRFVRSELWRFTRRVRRLMVKERLKGRPGILWRGPTGPKAKGSGDLKALGKNIRGWVRKSTLTAEVKISRFLEFHETGTHGVRAVPARLGFRELFDREKIAEIPRIENAMQRAADVLDKRANKEIARSAGALAFAARF